jgi:Cu/Ag efflux protein CusF
MKKHFIKTIGIGLVAAFALGTAITTQAADKKPAAADASKDSNRAIPFSGTINSIDKAAKTINIGKTKKKDIQITDQTKIKKDGKPATLDDAKVGDEVGGSYRDNGGKLEAGSLRIGPKPEGKADGKPAAKKKKE